MNLTSRTEDSAVTQADFAAYKDELHDNISSYLEDVISPEFDELRAQFKQVRVTAEEYVHLITALIAENIKLAGERDKLQRVIEKFAAESSANIRMEQQQVALVKRVIAQELAAGLCRG